MGQRQSSLECVLDAEIVEELRMKTTFSEDQVLRLFRVFLSLDSSGSGVISVGDLCNWEVFSSNPFLPRILDLFDPYGSQLLSFSEFVLMLKVFAPLAPPDEKTRFLFSLYDADGDGLVSKDDLIKVLQLCLGNYLDPTEIKSVAEKAVAENANIDPAGRISFEEFVKGIDLQQVVFQYSIIF
eukprot:ANDGO_02251.mRNA.1 Calcineurin subunit B